MKTAGRSSERESWSRRRFLATAVAGTAAAATSVDSAESAVVDVGKGQTLMDSGPEDALAKFGSEFGNIRQPR